MLNEVVLFFTQYCFAVVSCCIFFLLGRILLKIIPFDFYDNNGKLFENYLTIILGTVAIVLIYSIVIAKGKTINILLLPVLIGLFFIGKKENFNNRNNALFKNIPLDFLVIVPLFLLVLFHLFPETEYKQADALHYLHISENLNSTGQENYFGGAVNYGKQFQGTVPYHYFEFWINAILLKCFGHFLSGIQLLRFVCYSIISTVGLLGLFALAENIIKKPLNLAQKFLCVCFIFFIPNFLGYIHFLQPVLIYDFENNMLERPNLRIFYMFLPGIIITMGNQKFRWQNLFWITCAVITSFINFAVLIPSFILFCLVMVLTKKDKEYFYFLLKALLTVTILYFLFYHFTTSVFSITPDGIEKASVIKYLIRYWKIISFSSVTSIFYCLLVPLILMIIIKKYDGQLFNQIFREYKNKLGLCYAIIICAVVMSRALNFMDNAYQFAFLGYSAATVLFFILLVAFIKETNMRGWVMGCICTAFLVSFIIPRIIHSKNYSNIFHENGNYVYQQKKFSADYIENISTVFPAFSKINGAYWADAFFYDSVPYYSNRSPLAYTLPSGYILAEKSGFNYEICLSDSSSIMHGIDTSQKIIYDYLRSTITQSPFYQYGKASNVNEKRLSLIKKYNLQYLILTKNADTSVLSQLKITRRFQDSITGERFYLLKAF